MTAEFVQLKQTKGTFEARGVLFGVKGERAFKEMTTTNGKKMIMINLGLRIADGETMYLSLNGMEKDFVYFSKMGKKGEKPVTEKVEWAKRKRFRKEGYRLIGMGLALEKDADTGKNKEVQYMEAFDAAEYLQEHAEDGMSVFVKGNIEFGSFEDKQTKEIKKTTKFVPNGIYLNGTEINFQAADWKRESGFAQPVILTGVRREVGDDKDKTTSYFIDFATIGYKSYQESSIECTEALAKVLKDKVKPGTGITITGRIQSSQDVEPVTAEVWGEASTVGKAKTSARVSLLATGARPETMDIETYVSKELEAYRQACEVEKKTKESKKAGFESQASGAEAWGEKSEIQQPAESAW